MSENKALVLAALLVLAAAIFAGSFTATKAKTVMPTGLAVNSISQGCGWTSASGTGQTNLTAFCASARPFAVAGGCSAPQRQITSTSPVFGSINNTGNAGIGWNCATTNSTTGSFSAYAFCCQ